MQTKIACNVFMARNVLSCRIGTYHPKMFMKKLTIIITLLLTLTACQREAPQQTGPMSTPVAEHSDNLPNLELIFADSTLDQVMWNQVLSVSFEAEVPQQRFVELAKVMRSKDGSEDMEQVDVQVDIVSPNEYRIKGRGSETIWEPDFTYSLLIEGQLWGSKIKDFEETFMKPPTSEFYLENVEWMSDFRIDGDILLTDRYELTFSEQLSPSVMQAKFVIEPQPEHYKLEIGRKGVSIYGNFSPSVDYRLTVEHIYDIYGRPFHFPVIELPSGLSDTAPDKTRMRRYEPAETFFYTKDTAPRFIIEKGKNASDNIKVRICRLALGRETAFNETPFIYQDPNEQHWRTLKSRDKIMSLFRKKEDVAVRDCDAWVTRSIDASKQKVMVLDMKDVLSEFAKPFGIFSVYMEDEVSLNTSAHYVGIVNAGFLLKTGQENGTVFAFDLASGNPLSGLGVIVKSFTTQTKEHEMLPENPASIFGWLSHTPLATTDDNGVANFTIPEKFRSLSFGAIAETETHFAVVYAGWKGGLNSFNFPVTVSGGKGLDEATDYLDRAFASKHILGHAYTEKLLYRPGQYIHYKAMFRERDKTNLELTYPSFTKVRFEIISPAGETIVSEDQSLSSFGSTWDKYQLPDEAKLGSYRLQWTALEEKENEEGVSELQLITSSKTTTEISVQEYALPKFKVDALTEKHDYFSNEKIVIQLRAKEYSSAPLEGGKVRYRVIARPFYPEDTEDEGFTYDQEFMRFNRQYRNQTVLDQEDTLDANGVVTITLPESFDALTDEFDYTLSIEYTVIDDQKREVSNTVTVRSLRVMNEEDYVPGIKMQRGTYSVNTNVPFEFVSKDFRLKRVPEKPLALTIYQNVQRCETEEAFLKGEVTRCNIEPKIVHQDTLTTNAEGLGSYSHRFTVPGKYTIELTNAEKKVTKSVWITSRNMPPAIDSKEDRYLQMSLDKETYKLNEKALLTIHSPYPTSTLVLSFEANDVLHARVIEMTSPLLEYTIPMSELYMPNVYINGIVIEKNSARVPHFKIGYLNLKLDQSEKNLHVELSPDKSEYSPGEEATITITTKDHKGNPVPAEVSLAVVDEAIIRLGGQVDARLLRRFYSRRLLFVQNALTLVGLHHDRYFATYGGAGKGGYSYDIPPVRKLFEEVAFFNGSVKTNDNGTATISFTMPDTLTSYTLLAAGASHEKHLMGISEDTLTVKMDYYMDAILPRFLRHGDTADVVARVYNRTDYDASIEVRLEGEGFTLLSESQEVKTEVPKDKFTDVTFQVQIADDRDEVEFTFKTIGTAGTDAMQHTKPVHGYELFSEVQDTIAITGDQSTAETIAFPKYIDKSQGHAKFTIATSILSALKSSLHKLVSYPYGCAEQTISSTVPNALYAKLASSLGIKEDTRATEFTKEGLAAIASYQSDDGGFSYWKGGKEGDLYVSTVVGHGLADIKEAGFEIPAEIHDAFIAYLKKQIENTRQWQGGKNDRVSALDLVAIITLLDPTSDYVRIIEREFYRLPALSTRDLSLLAKIYTIRQPLISGPPRELLDKKLEIIENELWKSIVKNDNGTYHVERYEPYRQKRSFSTSNTDLLEILQTLIILNPRDGRIAPLIRQVYAPNKYKGYFSSFEERLRFAVLAEYLEYASQNTYVTNATISIAGNENFFAIKDIESEVLEYALPELLDEKNAISVQGEIDGDDNSLAFVSYDIGYKVHDVSQIVPIENGLKISRSIKTSKGKELNDFDTVKVGDHLQITLSVENPDAAQHVAITDALPATFEFIDPPQSATGFGHVDFRDERLDAFLSGSTKSASITYTVRVIADGTYSWPPAVGVAMYRPEVSGQSAGSKLTISSTAQ